MTVWWLSVLACAPGPQLLCNGQSICDEPFSQVTSLGTHNSAASTAYNFIEDVNANHHLTVTEQLDLGARMLMLDVYEEEGVRVLCHGPCLLGQVPHLDVLAEILVFLTAHPREVLSIIYQNAVDGAVIAQDLESAGLTSVLYEHDGTWPTLGQMIDDNTRLVVTVESGGGVPATLPNVWDLSWDTEYFWTDVSEMNCDVNRGNTDNALLLVNHWVSMDSGLPNQEISAQSNTATSIKTHVDQCPRQPTWVAVDFLGSGDAVQAVRDINEG